MMMVSWILTVLVSTAIVPPDHLERAWEHLQAGDYKAAQKEIVAGLDEAPEDADLHYLLAQVYFARADQIPSPVAGGSSLARVLKRDARTALEQATNLGCTDPSAWIWLAALLRDEGNVDGAVDVASRGVQTAPSLDLRWVLADLHLRKQSWLEAAAAAEAALEESPEHLELGWIAVQGHERGEQREKALEALRTLVRTHSAEKALADRMWNLHGANGDYEAAATFYRVMTEEAPDQAWFHFYLGAVLRRGEQFEQAVQAFEAALAVDPQLASARHEMGLTYNEWSRPQEAVVWLERALEVQGPLQPSIRNDLLILAGDLIGRNEQPLALRCVDAVLASEATNFFGLVNRALVLRQMGEIEASDEAYTRCIEVYPDDASLLNDHGLLFYGTGRLQEAVDIFETAAARDDVNALENLAMITWRERRLEECRGYLNRILELDPARSKAWYFLELVAREAQK